MSLASRFHEPYSALPNFAVSGLRLPSAFRQRSLASSRQDERFRRGMRRAQATF